MQKTGRITKKELKDQLISYNETGMIIFDTKKMIAKDELKNTTILEIYDINLPFDPFHIPKSVPDYFWIQTLISGISSCLGLCATGKLYLSEAIHEMYRNHRNNQEEPASYLRLGEIIREIIPDKNQGNHLYRKILLFTCEPADLEMLLRGKTVVIQKMNETSFGWNLIRLWSYFSNKEIKEIHSEEKQIKHAVLTGDAFEMSDPELKDALYFLLKDSLHEFTIGLSVVLRCLQFAEEKGEISKLPQRWWNEISALYPEFEELTDVPNYEEV